MGVEGGVGIGVAGGVCSGWLIIGSKLNVWRRDLNNKRGVGVGGWNILGFVGRPGGNCFGEGKEVESM